MRKFSHAEQGAMIRSGRTEVRRRPRDIGAVPSSLAPEDVAARMAEVAERTADEQAKAVAVQQAEKSLASAINADTRAGAEALRKETKDPGRKQEEKARAALEDRKRDVEVARLATDDAVADLEAAVEQHRATWLADLRGKRSTGVAEAQEALARLVDAMTSIDTISAVARWAESFPHAKGFRILSGTTPDITTSSGEPRRIADVLAAIASTLDAIAHPREERPLYVGNESKDDEMEAVEAR
jgi:hypothetical protein